MSNLPGGRDLGDGFAAAPAAPAGAAAFSFRPAQRHEIHAAIQLILSTSTRPAGEEQVVDFLRFAIYRGIDLKDTWVASSGCDNLHRGGAGGRLAWAILPVISPGRTMLLFAPGFTPPHIKDNIICPLVERILDHYRGRAVDLAQVLIDPAETAAIEMYQACRFEPLAELIYLDRDVRRTPEPELPPNYSWHTYSSATHGDFAAAVIASYQGSLDCPRLNGRRHIEDVLAGHKAAGEFDPNLWFLLRDGVRPAGVVLLNRSTRTDGLELVYLGLAPSYRGRKLGDTMMRHALATASSVGARRLSLAVDRENAPALRLYQRHGLTRLCSRLALMRDLRDPT